MHDGSLRGASTVMVRFAAVRMPPLPLRPACRPTTGGREGPRARPAAAADPVRRAVPVRALQQRRVPVRSGRLLRRVRARALRRARAHARVGRARAACALWDDRALVHLARLGGDAVRRRARACRSLVSRRRPTTPPHSARPRLSSERETAAALRRERRAGGASALFSPPRQAIMSQSPIQSPRPALLPPLPRAHSFSQARADERHLGEAPRARQPLPSRCGGRADRAAQTNERDHRSAGQKKHAAPSSLAQQPCGIVLRPRRAWAPRTLGRARRSTQQQPHAQRTRRRRWALERRRGRWGESGFHLWGVG